MHIVSWVWAPVTQGYEVLNGELVESIAEVVDSEKL